MIDIDVKNLKPIPEAERLYAPQNNQITINLIGHFLKTANQYGLVKLDGAKFDSKSIKESEEKSLKVTKSIQIKNIEELL